MPSRPRASTSSRCSAPSAAGASMLDRPLTAAKSRMRRSRRQAMYLVDEQDLAGRELAEHGDQIGGALNYRAGSGMEVDAHFAGDNLRERRFTQPGRPKKQDVVERFTAALRRLDKNAQV